MNGLLLLTTVPGLRGVLPQIPLVLLMACPALILVGAALPPLRGRPFLVAALLLLVLGTGGLYPGAPGGTFPWSGAAGAGLWVRSLYSEAWIIFTGLTAIYIAVIVMPSLLHRRSSRLFSTVLPLSFLVLYSAGTVFLLHTVNGAAGTTHGPGAPAQAPAAVSGSPDSSQRR